MKRLLTTMALLSLHGGSVLFAQDPGYRQERRPAAPAAATASTTAPATDDAGSAAGRISSMENLDDSRPLRIGDRVSLRIVEDRDKVLSLLVQDSGDIQSPFIGLVKASERTCKQVAYYMKRELEKQYFQQATVIVALEQARQERFRAGMAPDDIGYITIYGQVARQGRYELAPEEDLTISQAILRAGGLAQFANAKKVKLIRKLPGKPSVNIMVNLDDIMRKGKMEKDIPIRPDDVIIVDEKLVNF
jgi:protein involved in polysaccharide export with SLBB domain